MFIPESDFNLYQKELKEHIDKPNKVKTRNHNEQGNCPE